MKVPRKILEQLTCEEALELITRNEEFQQFMVGRTVTDTQLTIVEGLSGHLQFSIKVHDLAAVREQRKKLKAEKKQEKKLRQMKMAEKKKEKV